jgi:alpha-L-rhamnosidase
MARLVLFSLAILLTLSGNDGGLLRAQAGNAGDPQAEVSWEGAQWIGFTTDQRDAAHAGRTSLRGNNPRPVVRKTPVSPLLRQEFGVDRPVQSARAYVCGLGLYELSLNGGKVGDRVLDPAQTTYDKRAFYVVHDIGGQLRQGVNCVGLMLGNGFYGQNFAFGGGLGYGPPRALVLIDIEYSDGTRKQVRSGPEWKAAQGPVLFDNIYAGETYDARPAHLDGAVLPEPRGHAPDGGRAGQTGRRPAV